MNLNSSSYYHAPYAIKCDLKSLEDFLSNRASDKLSNFYIIHFTHLRYIFKILNDPR